MDSSTERLCFMQPSSLNPHKLETPGCEPGVSNYYEYSRTTISQFPHRASSSGAVEPKLRVHRDGRLSYRDPVGRWTRYTTNPGRNLFQDA